MRTPRLAVLLLAVPLAVGGCAGLFRNDERIPEAIVQQFIDQERLADLFYIEQANFEPEMTGESERTWIIYLYHQRRSVSPEICVGTESKLHIRRQQTEYVIAAKEITPIVALQGCNGTNELDFVLADERLTDHGIKRAIDDALGFTRAGKTADPTTAISFSSTVLRDNLHLVDPSRLVFFNQNADRIGLIFAIPGTYSVLVLDLTYRGDQLVEIDVRAEELDIRNRGPVSDFERSLYR
jgi:hypothetical protein